MMDFANPKPITQGKHYALFVPVVESEEGLALVYERRSPNLRRQPSEICFPGGKIDEGETVHQAAVRELYEELGVTPTEIYGETDFLIHRNGDVIYPVLGKIKPPFTPNESEVEKVLTIPISFLKTQKEEGAVLLSARFAENIPEIPEDYPFQTGKDAFPIYRFQGEVIWGMTGKITKSILGYL